MRKLKVVAAWYNSLNTFLLSSFLSSIIMGCITSDFSHILLTKYFNLLWCPPFQDFSMHSCRARFGEGRWADIYADAEELVKVYKDNSEVNHIMSWFNLYLWESYTKKTMKKINLRSCISHPWRSKFQSYLPKHWNYSTNVVCFDDLKLHWSTLVLKNENYKEKVPNDERTNPAIEANLYTSIESES